MVTLKDKMALLSSERRAKIEAEADQLQDEYLTLQALRKAKALTQSQLAETLGYQQATIAQMEKRSDLMLSTVNGRVKVSQRAAQNVATLGLARLPRERALASGRPRLSQSWRLPGCFGPLGPNTYDVGVGYALSWRALLWPRR